MRYLIFLVFIALPFQLFGKDFITKQEKNIIKLLKKSYKLESVNIQRPNKILIYYELLTKDGKSMVADSTGNIIIPQSKSINDAYRNRIKFVNCTEKKNIFLTTKSIGGGNYEYQYFSTQGELIATYNGKLSQSPYSTIFIYQNLIGNFGLVSNDGKQILPNDYSDINVDSSGICKLTQLKNGIERRGAYCLSNKTRTNVPCDFYNVDYCELEKRWKIKVHEYDSTLVYNDTCHYDTSFLDEGQKLFESNEFLEARKFYTINSENTKWAYFYIGASFYKEIMQLRECMNSCMKEIKTSCDRKDISIATELRKNLQLLTSKIEKSEQSFNVYLSRDTRYYTKAQEMLFDLSELKNNIIGYKEEIAMAITDLERRCTEFDKIEHEAYLKELEQKRLNIEMHKIQEQKLAREQHEREIRMKKEEYLRRKQKEKNKKVEDKKTKEKKATFHTDRSWSTKSMRKIGTKDLQ